MIIGEVRTFPKAVPNKKQVIKVLEEAAEVFGAWQTWNTYHELMEEYPICDNHEVHMIREAQKRDNLLDECADVIMAISNLVSGFGIDDFVEFMKKCEERQEKRGRYDLH